MKTRYYQKFHDYIFDTLADTEQGIEKKPETHRAAYRVNKIKQIKQFFFDEKNPLIKKKYTKKFRNALRKLNAKQLEIALYGNNSDTLEEKEYYYSFPNDKEIENKFNKFEKEFCYFDHPQIAQALKQFIAYFKMAKLVGDFIEENNAADNDIASHHAYKLLILFGNKNNPKNYFQSLEHYLSENNFNGKRTPLHDALIWPLPVNDLKSRPIHLSEWRRLIYRSGPRACRIFSKALAIEKQLDKEKPRAPKNIQEALEAAKSITFSRMMEDPELADLCIFYNVNETNFNKCLEIKKNIKTHDFLPQIIVDGEEVNYPDYQLVKLPIHDPRAFILGHLTNCCQSIGGNSEACVIDGLTLKNNGFYVLLHKRKHTIVGQGYLWKSIFGNLVFDSWENLRSEHDDNLYDDAVIVPMLEIFSRKVVEKDPSILRVCIGQGGKTPGFYKQMVEVVMPEAMLEGTPYIDSMSQSLIYCNEKLQDELYRKILLALDAILKKCNNPINAESLFEKKEIFSTSQVEIILHFLQKNTTLEWYLSNKEKRFLDLLIHKKISISSLALLDQAELFTREFMDQFFKCKPEGFEIDCCSIAINSLYCLKILNPYFVMLVHSRFTLDRWKLIAEELCRLKNYNILSESLAKYLIEKVNLCYWTLVIDGLVELKKENIFIDRNINIVLEANFHSSYCSHALINLKKEGLLVEPYITYISKAEGAQIHTSHAITLLKNAELLNEENINLVMINPRCALKAAEAIVAISKKINPQEFNYLDCFNAACSNKNIPFLQFLIDHQVIDVKSPEFSPIETAAYEGDIEVLQFLLNAGAPLERKYADMSLLHHAVRNSIKDNSNTIHFLINKKADINALNRNGDSPLILCMKLCNLQHIAVLLNYENIVIDKEKLLDEKSYHPCDVKFQKVGKAIIALHEVKLLNKENINFITDCRPHPDVLEKKLELINAMYDANILDKINLDSLKSLSKYHEFDIFFDLLEEAKIPLPDIQLGEVLTKLKELHTANLFTRENVKNLIISKEKSSPALLFNFFKSPMNEGKGHVSSSTVPKNTNFHY